MNIFLPSQLLLIGAFAICRAEAVSESEKTQIVNKHNQLRNSEGSSSMMQLKWSEELAEYAATWANQCDFSHGQPPEASSKGDIGQNLYVSTAPNWNWNDAIQSWYNEKPFYDYATNQCESGHMCGHYTQIVWATTTDVGCAVQVCSSNIRGTPFQSGHLIVCNYLPPGNYRGQKPY